MLHSGCPESITEFMGHKCNQLCNLMLVMLQKLFYCFPTYLHQYLSNLFYKLGTHSNQYAQQRYRFTIPLCEDIRAVNIPSSNQNQTSKTSNFKSVYILDNTTYTIISLQNVIHYIQIIFQIFSSLI